MIWTRRARQWLDLVHSNIWGPITPTSSGGNKYFHTFTNDYSGKIWIYLLTEKKEVFNTFKELKNLVEIQSGYKLK